MSFVARKEIKMNKRIVLWLSLMILIVLMLWYNSQNHFLFGNGNRTGHQADTAPGEFLRPHAEFLRPHAVPQLPDMPLVGAPCAVNGLAWNCIGMDRYWGLVFIDHRPGERRTVDVVRMLSRSVSLVIHDTEQPTYGWPPGWLGRRNYTERTFLQERKDEQSPKHLWSIGTTLLQGDLDKDGSVFDRIVEAIENNTETIKELEKNGMNFAEELGLEKPSMAYGTHLRLLRSAAKLTDGDILEFGTGLFSTPELDRVVSQSGCRRMIVSVESDLLWLRHMLTRLTSAQHQFLMVPAYSDLVGCYSNRVKQAIQISPQERELLGKPGIGKQHFRDITCKTKMSLTV